MRISARQALEQAKSNRFNAWHHGTSSNGSLIADDASGRIHEGFAMVEATPPVRTFDKKAPVFAMGSCFAREIEAALRAAGGNVISLDLEKIERPEFRDAEGQVRTGFFHRFTPRAMWQEFKIAFDETPGWDADTSLLFKRGGELIDFNYWGVKGFNPSLEAHRVRRAIAREFVQRVTESELIILTLGLTESWMHKPTGFHCNRVQSRVLARQPDDFDLMFLEFDETLFCLTDILRMLKSYHLTGDFQLVVTVSPVPLQVTFSTDDVIVANERSKSVLRAAADRFCTDNPEVRYFPSYEIVRLSEPSTAWRPDRLHVEQDMVRHIVKAFERTYFE